MPEPRVGQPSRAVEVQSWRNLPPAVRVRLCCQALPLRGGGVDLHWLPFLAGGGKAGPLEVPHEHRAAFADWPF